MSQPPYNAQDVVANYGIQIQIRADGKVIWINVDGVLKLRLLLEGTELIEIEDNRRK